MVECGGLENRLTLNESYEGSNPSSSARQRVVISGFMGAGKTTVGHMLADRMSPKIAWVDLDEYIEEAYSKSISEIFASEGEENFRDTEYHVLMFLLDVHPKVVISAGGGSLVQERIIEDIPNKDVTVIYLDVPFEVAYDRIKDESDNRALATSKEDLEKLYNQRQDIYKNYCHYYINADQAPEAIADEILKYIEGADK